MKQEVAITIRGIHRDADGNEDEVVTRAQGTHHVKEDMHYISFRETDPETGEETNQLIKYRDGLLEVIKKGHSTVKMVFDLRHVTACDYRTPYGILPMSIKTELVRYKEDEKGIRIRAKYRILWNGEAGDGGSSLILIEVGSMS